MTDPRKQKIKGWSDAELSEYIAQKEAKGEQDSLNYKLAVSLREARKALDAG